MANLFTYLVTLGRLCGVDVKDELGIHKDIFFWNNVPSEPDLAS